jgi:glycosyltransferase involved in cell wall biosynthesis
LKLLIYGGGSAFSDYVQFAKALPKFGLDTICLRANDFMSEAGPLKVVPRPRLLTLVKQYDPDLVIVDLPYYTPQMAKLTGRTVMYHMLGNIWTEFALYKVEPRLVFARMYNYYLGAIFNQGIKKTDIILANSMWLLKIIKEKMPEHPANLLYTGIDASNWVPHQKDRRELKHPAVVGTIDFTVRQKVSGLLKFTRVIKKLPDVNFYFAGNGPYFNLLKEICPPNLNLMGQISLPEVAQLLDSGDVFAHPSGLDVLPRSVKEASLMEKPIVASKVGGIPELVRDNETGYVCDIDDVNQWIEKISYLLDNPEIGIKFGKKAREFMLEKFGWEKIAENFVKDIEAFACSK